MRGRTIASILYSKVFCTTNYIDFIVHYWYQDSRRQLDSVACKLLFWRFTCPNCLIMYTSWNAQIYVCSMHVPKQQASELNGSNVRCKSCYNSSYMYNGIMLLCTQNVYEIFMGETVYWRKIISKKKTNKKLFRFCWVLVVSKLLFDPCWKKLINRLLVI